MIQVTDIRILEDYPGYVGFMAEVRLQDESQGYHDTEFGPMLNYDKTFNVKGPTLEHTITLVSDRLTEVLSDSDSTNQTESDIS